MEIVKNKVENDIILSNHELSDEEIIKVYSTQIKKLINRLSFEREKKNAVWDLYEQQEKELEIYKKALELACERYIGVDGISYVLRDNGEEYWNMSDEQVLKETVDYFIKEAKEKIDEQKTSKKERKE